MKSANAVIPFPNAQSRRDRDELAFLPAALEIVETPPSPIGRAIAATVITLFCLALAWAAFGKIDIVASAPGKIIASGRTKIIQPFETGVVSAIHVRDGTIVKAGDVLIELDPTMNLAERNHLQSDFIAAQLDIARLKAAHSEGDDPIANFHPPQDATPAQIAMQRQFLISQTAEHRAKVAALDRQKAQKEAERATIAATISKLEGTTAVLQQRVDIRSALYDKQLGSKLIYLETFQLLVEQQHELAVQKSRLQEAEAAVAAIIETRAQTVAEFRRTLFDELNKAEQKAAGLAHDVVKAEQRTKLQMLTAPVDGVVQQLAVHTVGGVVTPAQALLVVVPVDSHLEIEAMVSNRDIGFVHAGQDAEISRSILSLSPVMACCTGKCSACRRMPSPATSRRTNRSTRRQAPIPARASSKGRKCFMPRASRSIGRRCRSRIISGNTRPQLIPEPLSLERRDAYACEAGLSGTWHAGAIVDLYFVADGRERPCTDARR